MGDYLSIRVFVMPSELEEVERIARDVGINPLRAEPVATEAVEASATATPPSLIGAGSLLVGRFVVRLIDRLHAGITIDVRPLTGPIVRGSEEVPYGWAQVITPDDKSVRIQTRGTPLEAAESLLREILFGSSLTATAVEKAGKEVLGVDKVTSTIAAPP
jgi:hypothetical protein